MKMSLHLGAGDAEAAVPGAARRRHRRSSTETDPDDGVHVVPGVDPAGTRRAAAAAQRPVQPTSCPTRRLLPPESIRFFYLDRNWTDSLVDGVLSIGTFTSAERTQLESLRQVVRAEVDEAERVVRSPGGEARLSGPGGAVSGFLLRSRLASGWPGLHVRGYRVDRRDDDEILPESDPDRLKVAAHGRLAPAVLLVLFDGVPAVVHLEEPRQGIQFGVIRPEAEPLSTARELPLRDASNAADLPHTSKPVPFRRGSAGVVHLRRLRDRIAIRARHQASAATRASRSTRTSSRWRCCASRTGRCSATRQRAGRAAGRRVPADRRVHDREVAARYGTLEGATSPR